MAKRIRATVIGIAVAATSATTVMARPAQAADCVLGQDPPGDARSLPGDSASEHDLIGLRSKVDKESVRFVMLSQARSPRPAPGRQFVWSLQVKLTGGGSADVVLVRDATGDAATLQRHAQNGQVTSSPAVFGFDDLHHSVWVEVLYRDAGVRPGTRMSAIAATTQSTVGSSVPGLPRALPSNTGANINVEDELRASKDVVVGRGC